MAPEILSRLHLKLSFPLLSISVALFLTYRTVQRLKNGDASCIPSSSQTTQNEVSIQIAQQYNAEFHISSRARLNLNWFLQKHSRQISRLDSSTQSQSQREPDPQPQTPKRINMMTAENWLMRDSLIPFYKNAINESFTAAHLSYADGLGGDADLLDAAAGFFNGHFRPVVQVRAAHVVAGAGVSALLGNLLWDLCEIGDGVLVDAPFWGGFENTFVLRSRVTPVVVDSERLPETQQEIGAYIGRYEAAISNAKCAVRAILLCNPHNPRGYVYSRPLLEALLRFAAKHDLHFVSDEIYALSTFVSGSRPFCSILEIDLDALNVRAEKVHLLYGMSKDFGSSGLRCGFAVTQANPQLRLSMAISNHSSVSTLTSVAVTALFRDSMMLATAIQQNTKELSIAAATFIAFAKSNHLEYFLPAAGVYGWVRLGGARATWESEAYLNDLLEEAGVSAGAGSGYREAQPGWFRLTFSIPEEELRLGLERCEGVLQEYIG